MAKRTGVGGADTGKFINPSQVGGIERYRFDDGPGRGTRALCFNTGGGLRYRVLVDRGFDIDHSFYHQHSLSFLTQRGPVAPSPAHNRGLGWLESFPGGLLTTCGPFSAGAPVVDDGQALPIHGTHSNTPAEIESVVQPDPHAGRLDMSATALLRYGSFFGPNLQLRRTIRSALGSNVIAITDEFRNPGNTAVPHAWLLHINFGYPLVDEGAELCFDGRVEGRIGATPDRPNLTGHPRERRVPPPQPSHRGSGEAFGYVYPRPVDRGGNTTVAIVNRAIGVGVAIHYNTRQFPRLGNWQHWGPGEYVTALEPMNCGVEGRTLDRERGWLDSIGPGQTKRYEYRLEVVSGREAIENLRRLNR